jgi:signal transduction protein with GAF and PtsI domain
MSVDEQDPAAILEDVIEQFDCSSGTIHRADDELLTLVADHGIPEEVRGRVRRVPVGKGMAGLAAERTEPVQLCNLQGDVGDVAEPGAQATGLRGTIAAPMVAPDGTLKGVIGVGKQAEYEFSDDEEEELLRIGRRIAERW